MFQSVPRRRCAAAPGIGYYVELSALKNMAVESIELSQSPLTPGSHHCAADPARGGDTESARLSIHLHEKQHHMTTGYPDAVSINPLKIGSLLEPKICRISELSLRRQSAYDPCVVVHIGSCGRSWYAF